MRSGHSAISIALGLISLDLWIASLSRCSLAVTAVNDEIDWNWVTISENAPNSVPKAMVDWVITPNSIPWRPRMNIGAMISAGMIWMK